MVTANTRVSRVSTLVLLSLLVLTSCSVPPTSKRDKASHEFMALDESRLSPEDFDKAYEMCKSLLQDSYYAKTDPSKIDLARYVVDPNLLKYSQMKVKKEAHDLSITSIDAKLVKSERQDDCFFLTLNAVVTQSYGGRFGEDTQFLVKNLNGRLVVADWFTEHGTTSFFDLQHRGDQGVTNPTIWEDPEKVEELFKSAEIQ